MGVFSIVISMSAALAAFFLANIPIYYAITGTFPVELDDNDPAFKYIFNSIYPEDNLLSTYCQMWTSVFAAVSLPALMKAPRVWRVGPCLVMVVKLIYVHTVLEGQYVLEATGHTISTFVVVAHGFLAAVYIGILFLPDRPREPVARTTVGVIAYVLLYFNLISTVILMGYALVYNELPVDTDSHPADQWIISQLITDNPLQVKTLLTAFLAGPFVLLALPHVSRALRVVPVLVFVYGTMVVNTYFENKFVLEATGYPIQNQGVFGHVLVAVTTLLILFMPEAGAVSEQKKGN